MRAAVYLRISSDPTGAQLGVGRQREDCAKLCSAKGWDPVEYMDNDISASNGKHRPAYQQMLSDIQDGTVGAVVAWDLDRLHRRPIELERFMELADSHHLALATVSGDVDLSTAQGRLVARLKGAVARHEVDQMKARQCRKARQNAEQGIPKWRRAFGYLDDTHQPDPVTAPLVKAAYSAVLAGSSLGDICRTWNEAGALTLNGKPWVHAQVSNFLRKPRNAGLRAHNGEVIGQGTWPPLVDESTWRAAQAVLNNPSRKPGRKTVRKHLLTGVLGCGNLTPKHGDGPCGHYLSGHITLDNKLAYNCKKCRGVSIRAEHVEPLLYDLVIGRLSMPDAADLLKAEIHDQAEAEAVRDELNTLYQELEQVGIERGQRLLTGQQAATATAIIQADIAKLEARQQDAERIRIFDGLQLGTPEVELGIRALSPDRFRAVLSVLAEITVAPVGKGHKVFNPERVHVVWK
jgi:DNA invertase Pin-like site-specific DNA recombinase